MKNSISVLFWINKARISSKTNLVPIYARITINGKRAEISTGKSIQSDNWIANAGRVKGNTESARTINRYLDTVNIALHTTFEKLVLREGKASAEEVKSIFLGKNSRIPSLIELFNQHNEDVKSQIGRGFSERTYERYQISLKHLQSYIKTVQRREDIDLQNINYAFLTKLEHYLKVTKQIGHNTAMKYIKNTRKIVLLAQKNQLIDHDPFAGFKITQQEVKKEFLNMDEIRAIRDKEFKMERLSQVRDIFIFCCYTGLAYVDVEKLILDDIKTGLDGEKWIVINRQKTGVQSNIPILPEASELVTKYIDHESSGFRKRIFPVVSNQKMNAYLKEIGDVCGINKKMTFHMARHTFATTITLSNGVSMETVGSMLGHKNLKTTQIYAKVVQEKVSREMMALREKLRG